MLSSYGNEGRSGKHAWSLGHTAERSGLGWSLAFLPLRVLSPAGNSLHLAGNELPGLSAVPWVCQLGTPAARHRPCHHPQEHAGTGTPSFPTSPPCSLGWTRENLHTGLWLGWSPPAWRGQWRDSWIGAHLGLRLVVAGAGEGSVCVPPPLLKPSLLSILSPSTAAPIHPCPGMACSPSCMDSTGGSGSCESQETREGPF